MSITVITSLTTSKGLVQSGATATALSSTEIAAGYQPLDGTLTALAALTIAANTLTVGTGADAFSQTTFAANTFPARSSSGNIAATTITDFALTILDDADAAAVRATIGAQPLDATLTALAGLTIAANSITVGTGADAFSQLTFTNSTFLGRNASGSFGLKTVTDFALSLLDDTDAATARATLGVGAGTVTSVALTVPSILSVSGSPVTTSGTFAVTLATQTANTLFAGPTSGGAASPTFRPMDEADIPTGTIGTRHINPTVPPSGFNAPLNLAIIASVASNALTLAIKGTNSNDPSVTNPVLLPFRSATLTSGISVWRGIAAANSLVISSGSTLGATSGVPFRIWLVLFDDAGTIRLGAINCTSLTAGAVRIYSLAESGVVSSTAEGGAGAADALATFYTGSAVTSKSFRVIGFVEYASGLTTAGTWDAAPTTVQLYGPGVRLPGTTIQTAYMYTSTGFSTASGTAQTTTITQAITPSSACNVMRVEHSGQIESDGINKPAYVRSYRDSTAIGAVQALYVAQNLTVTPCAMTLLDAPQSASSVTYSAKLWGDGSTTVHYPAATLGAPPYGQMILTELMG